MVKKSKVYKVICDNMADKYVLADSFSKAEDIVNQYIQDKEYHIVSIQSIIDKGDIFYEDNRAEG